MDTIVSTRSLASHARAEMDATVEPAPDVQKISLWPLHSLVENYSNDHKTLLEITKKALCTCLEEHQPTCPTYP